MIDKEIISYSRSYWSTPSHFISKSNIGGTRVTGRYCRLNDVAVVDKFSFPHLYNLISVYKKYAILLQFFYQILFI